MNDERAKRRDQLLSELHEMLSQARQNPVGSPERERIVIQMEPLYRVIFALGENLMRADFPPTPCIRRFLQEVFGPSASGPIAATPKGSR